MKVKNAFYTSHHFTPHGRYELNKLTSLSMCGFIAQLVEQRTGNAEVTGSNPVEALIFFRLLLSNCLNWKIYCDDHSSLSSTTAVQKWIISYTSHQTLVSCPTNTFIWKVNLTYADTLLSTVSSNKPSLFQGRKPFSWQHVNVPSASVHQIEWFVDVNFRLFWYQISYAENNLDWF